jgi:hypothetical protein
MSAHNGNIKLSISEAEVWRPQCEDFKIFFADDMTEIKAIDCEGNEIPFASASGPDVNIYQNDGTLTADRTLSGDSDTYSLTFEQLAEMLIQNSNGDQIRLRNDLVEIFSNLTDGTINLDAKNVVIGDPSLADASFKTVMEGRALVENVNGSGINPELEIRASNALALMEMNTTGGFDIIQTWRTDGVTRVVTAYDQSANNWQLAQTSINANVKLLMDFNANRFRIITPRIQMQLMPSYVSVAAAQADGSLVIGDLYRLSTGSAETQSRVRIKV